MQKKSSQKHYNSLEGRAKTLLKTTKRKGENFKDQESDMDLDFIIERLENDKCEVTGIPFNFENTFGTMNNPLAPSIDRINGTGLIKRPDRYQGEDLIKGSYKGVKFEVSDINLKERVETRDSKGNVQVSYQTYFKGRWYIYRYQKQFDEVLKIVEGRGGYANKRGLVKFETESMAFNKKFAIYASSKEFGFYLITSSMLEKLLELEALHRGSIVYCYQNNELHIGVNDRRDYMEFKLKTPINEKTLDIFMSDIDLIPSIINEFRLDSSKFK